MTAKIDWHVDGATGQAVEVPLDVPPSTERAAVERWLAE